MRGLSFGEIGIHGEGQALNDFALFLVEFGPGFQTSFFTSRTDGIKQFFHNALSCLRS